MGFEEATPIQEQAIPAILDGEDVIAVAQTGTGKTAAYLLPVIDDIELDPVDSVTTIIIAPTRELASQIDKQMEGFAYFTHANSYAIYGGGSGESFESEKQALTKGTNIIVATPGRLMSHLNLGYFDFSKFRHLILDEADRMLDMGFYDDIMRIIRKLPEDRQTLMFSATMPDNIRMLAKNIMKPNPAQVNIAISKPAEGVLQAAYMVFDKQKNELITRLLEDKRDEYQSVIIFSSTKKNVKAITHALNKAGIPAKDIHSDLNQEERESVLLDFRNRKLQIIVATDILARGIDIDNISLVVNYDVPNDAEDYVHRIGRTARADKTGVGLTFINPADVDKFSRIERLIETEIPKLPLLEGMGEAPVYAPRRGGSKKKKWSGNKRRGGGGKRKFQGKRKGGGPKGGHKGGGHKSGGQKSSHKR